MKALVCALALKYTNDVAEYAMPIQLELNKNTVLVVESTGIFTVKAAGDALCGESLNLHFFF